MLQTFFQNNFATLSFDEQKKIGFIVSEGTFIPEAAFKELFKQAHEMAVVKGLKAFVFDKRKMKIFHQGSMEWYHIDWKRKLLPLGLRNHFKLLPKDELFRKSVEVGKSKILSMPKPTIEHLEQVNVHYVEDEVQLWQAIDALKW